VVDSADRFEETLQALLGPVRGFCERMLGDRQEAEDAAQQAFLQAFRAWERFEGRASRKTWIFRIAANVCARVLEQRRKAGPDPVELDPAVPAGGARPEAGLECAERAQAVRAALLGLSPAHRLVLVLFCLEELSHAEIADLLGCPEGTVWSRLHHAKHAFEARLRRLAPDEALEVSP